MLQPSTAQLSQASELSPEMAPSTSRDDPASGHSKQVAREPNAQAVDSTPSSLVTNAEQSNSLKNEHQQKLKQEHVQPGSDSCLAKHSQEQAEANELTAALYEAQTHSQQLEAQVR